MTSPTLSTNPSALKITKKPATEVTKKAPDSGGNEPPQDSVSFGYKVLRGGVATVGAGVGMVAGAVYGAATQTGAEEVKVPRLAKRALGFVGAAVGFTAALVATPVVGPLLAAGGLVAGSIVGAAAGAGLPDAVVGAAQGVKSGAQLGWQIAGGAVDKISSLFTSKDKDKPAPPDGGSDGKPPTNPPASPEQLELPFDTKLK